MSTTSASSNPRPRRKAAIEAGKHVRDILEWECLPENSVKFQLIAAEFDKQFEAERQARLVNAGDIEDDNASNSHEMGSDLQMSEEDEEMNEDDRDFVEDDSDYNESDATFVLSDADSCELSSVDNDVDVQQQNLTLEEELMDCMDPHPETVAFFDPATRVLETETDMFFNTADGATDDVT